MDPLPGLTPAQHNPSLASIAAFVLTISNSTP